MAASIIPAAGSAFGPCLKACEHRDCAELRQMASELCVICDEPIRYERLFYREGKWFYHALCLLREKWVVGV